MWIDENITLIKAQQCLLKTRHDIFQGLENFFCKRPESTFFGFAGHEVTWQLFISALGEKPRQYVNEWAGLCHSKTFFTKMGRLNLTKSCSLQTCDISGSSWNKMNEYNRNRKILMSGHHSLLLWEKREPSDSLQLLYFSRGDFYFMVEIMIWELLGPFSAFEETHYI